MLQPDMELRNSQTNVLRSFRFRNTNKLLARQIQYYCKKMLNTIKCSLFKECKVGMINRKIIYK